MPNQGKRPQEEKHDEVNPKTISLPGLALRLCLFHAVADRKTLRVTVPRNQQHALKKLTTENVNDCYVLDTTEYPTSEVAEFFVISTLKIFELFRPCAANIIVNLGAPFAARNPRRIVADGPSCTRPGAGNGGGVKFSHLGDGTSGVAG